MAFCLSDCSKVCQQRPYLFCGVNNIQCDISWSMNDGKVMDGGFINDDANFRGMFSTWLRQRSVRIFHADIMKFIWNKQQLLPYIKHKKMLF